MACTDLGWRSISVHSYVTQVTVLESLEEINQVGKCQRAKENISSSNLNCCRRNTCILYVCSKIVVRCLRLICKKLLLNFEFSDAFGSKSVIFYFVPMSVV